MSGCIPYVVLGILIGILLIIVAYLGITHSINESNSYDDILVVTGQTVIGYGDSSRGVCVLEDSQHFRIYSDGDSGCKYDVGDIVKVHISKNGNRILELVQ